MKLPIKVLFCFLLFAFQLVSAQFKQEADFKINKDFIQYLNENQLNRELSTYFEKHKFDFQVQDSLHFYKADFALRMQNMNLFITEFDSCTQLFSSDSLRFRSANALFLKADSKLASRWFLRDTSIFVYPEDHIIYQSFLLANDPKNINANFLESELRYSFDNYLRYYRKKPFVAGALSMLVPGLGKLYNGRKHGFFPSFLTNVLYGWQAIESIDKLGYKHPYSIITAGIFTVFYLSNIYGSAHDLVRVKKEKKEVFLHEVSNHYNPGVYR